jgi:hypothetical protein
MAISKSTPIDFAKISQEMAWVTSRWMNGAINIVDPNTSGQTWNPSTNEYTGGSETILWSGSARIQPLGSGSNPEADYAFSSAGVRRIRIQVNIDPARDFVRKGLRVRVTDGGEDVDLVKLDFVVINAINSSYAWLRTIECEADMKNVIS